MLSIQEGIRTQSQAANLAHRGDPSSRRSNPSWTTETTSAPLCVKSRPVVKPRAPVATGLCCS